MGTFNQLVLAKRHRDVKVGEIAALAGIGRSTFYEYYASADDLFLQSLSRPFAVLADAAGGTGAGDDLENLLDHLWENRQRARERLRAQEREKIARMLAGMIDARLTAEGHSFIIAKELVAMQLAESALALISGWLMAVAACPPDRLAAAIMSASTALRISLRD